MKGDLNCVCAPGWTMISKAVSGVSSPKVAHLWNSPLTLSENVNAALDINCNTSGTLQERNCCELDNI